MWSSFYKVEYTFLSFQAFSFLYSLVLVYVLTVYFLYVNLLRLLWIWALFLALLLFLFLLTTYSNFASSGALKFSLFFWLTCEPVIIPGQPSSRILKLWPLTLLPGGRGTKSQVFILCKAESSSSIACYQRG